MIKALIVLGIVIIAYFPIIGILVFIEWLKGDKSQMSFKDEMRLSSKEGIKEPLPWFRKWLHK